MKPSPHATSRFLLPCLCALALLATACVSKQTGKLGNLVFSYAADDDPGDFNKPIAVGAKLDLFVRSKKLPKKITVLSATSSEPGILDVVHTEPGHIVLQAKGEGTAEIEVQVQKEDGTRVGDKVDMRAAKAEVVKIRHYCTKDKHALYLTAQTIWLPFDMERSNGEATIGYGYYPFESDPDTGLVIHQGIKAQAHVKLTTSSAALTATLKSTIDGTELSLGIIDQAEIDGARLDTKEVLRKIKTPVLVRPLRGGEVICQARADIAVVSKTPGVCAVKVLPTAVKHDDDRMSWGWIEIAPADLGTCTFELTHLKGANGKGVTTELSVEVVEIVKRTAKG